MREEDNIKEALKLAPNFMGFIFFEKSPRNISSEHSLPLLQSFLPGTKKIGVFVNETLEIINEKVNNYFLDGVQLHGNESPEFCNSLKVKGQYVIKAFSVGENFNFDKLEPYLEVVDLFLFDTKAKGAYGGHGVSFNWEILKLYPFEKPFLLAGGVGLNNLDDLKILEETPLLGIDVNSKFEIKPGLKDIKKLERLSTYLN